MISYYKLLVFRPILVLFVISVFSLSCILTALLLKPLPDFSDPTLGFEARGTEISKKITTWRNLLEETRPSGSLIVNPKEIQKHEFEQKKRKNKTRHQHKKLKFDKKIKLIKELSTNNKSFNIDIAYNSNFDDPGNDTTIEEHSHYDYGTNKSYDEKSTQKMNAMKREKWLKLNKTYPPALTSTDYQSSDGYFCESPSEF
jgi:protein dispatched 1